MKNNSLKNSFIWNALGSSLNAFTSLIFLIIATRINGEKEAGIFTLCYATAGLFYIVATYSGRTYQVTELDRDVTDNEFIITRIITSLMAIFGAIIFGILNGYKDIKLIILILLCTFKIVEAISDVFHGIFQKNNRLDKVGKSLSLRSILNTISFFLVNLFTHNLIMSILSMIVIDIIVLIFFDIKNSSKYRDKPKKVNSKQVIKLLAWGFFTFGFTLLSNYIVNIPRYAIDMKLSENYQTIFGIIVMPSTFIILLSQFIIQPFIIKLKDYKVNKDNCKFNKIIGKTIFLIFLIGFISTVCAYFFGIPVLNLLYGLELSNYLYNLIIILIGVTFYTGASILSNGLIVLRKTKIQLLIYIGVAIFGIFISRIMVNKYGFSGGSYSYLIIMMLLFLLYIITFLFINNRKINFGKKGV